MENQHVLMPFSKVIHYLRMHCHAGLTGAFYLATDQGHWGEFLLDQGRIVASRYRALRGIKALQLLRRSAAQAKYSFNPEGFKLEDRSKDSEVLPETENDPELGFISTSNNWIASSGSSERYETGYWYASVQAVSDPATFWFYAAEPGAFAVDAWWTSGTNRSSSAPFVITDDSGSTEVVEVDMTTQGGQWNELGSWSFAAGWNKVQLSRWTSGSGVVIADAVRVRKL